MEQNLKRKKDFLNLVQMLQSQKNLVLTKEQLAELEN